MGFGLNLLGAWTGDGRWTPADWHAMAGNLAIALPFPSGTTALGLLMAALFFFVLWVVAWGRNHRHVDERQMLRFELLSRDEALKREQSDLALAREALRVHAVRDDLTGLANRTSIVEVLDRELARAVRDKSTLSVVLADVDHLTEINETHGQPGGMRC